MNNYGIALICVLVFGVIGLFTIGFSNGIAVGLIFGIIVGLLVSILIVLEKIYRELTSKSQTNDTN